MEKELCSKIEFRMEAKKNDASGNYFFSCYTDHAFTYKMLKGDFIHELTIICEDDFLDEESLQSLTERDDIKFLWHRRFKAKKIDEKTYESLGVVSELFYRMPDINMN